MSLSDLLGRIGEQLNIGPYKHRQDNMQIGKAIGKYPNNPDAAIASIAEIDPQIAMAYQNAQATQATNAIRAKNQGISDLANARDKGLESLDRARGIVSSLLRSSDAASWTQNKALAEQLYKNRGLTDYAPIPDEMPTDSSWFDNYGMTPKDLSAASDRSRGRDIQQQNADTNATRADTYSRKAAADVALSGGRLMQQGNKTVADTNIKAGNMYIGAVKPPAARGGRKSTTAAPSIPPPMKSTSANQRINDRATNTVWKGDGNGGWVKQ